MKQPVETITGKRPENVPTFVYEALVAAHERTRRLLIIAIIILSIAFAATNGYWIYEFTQYDTVDYEYTQDGEGTNVIGTGNEVSYGTETKDPDQN